MSKRHVNLAAGVRTVIPDMRAFAHTLDDDRNHADGCVYEAIIIALRDMERIGSGTEARLSLFRILYAQYFFCGGNGESPKYGGADNEDTASSTPTVRQKNPLIEFRSALMELAPKQRAALILVGPAGFSPANAACIGRCAVATIHSLIDQAVTRLAEMIRGVPQEPLDAYCQIVHRR